jgi:hypothetical protein
MTPTRVVGAAIGAAVWVAGILLLDGRAATIVFAVVFALALPAAIHIAEGERAERSRTLGLAGFLLVLLPVAALVFDSKDGLALLVPVGVAAGLLGNVLGGDRPRRSAR